MCWLNLANAYGSVQHDLIRYSLEHYHAPQQMVAAVSNLYQGLVVIVWTKEWSTEPFPMQIGVYQGDPLSVIIFNTVMNTLVDTISQSHQQLGYSLTKSIHWCNLLQYADDTSLLAHGPAACQALLECTERWLHWSGMKPKVPKCCSLAVEASSGKAYDPQLSLCGERIPFIGNTTFKFLGAPVSVHNIQEETRSTLSAKLERLLSRVDATLVTGQQKLRLFRDAVCPRLTWDLSIADLPISWVEKNLDVMVTRFLKRWTGLARSADTSRLYLPKSLGGLQLPLPSTLYKKLQCAKAATLMSSRDPLIRHLATRDTLAEAEAQRKSLKPYQQVVEAMHADPGANRKATAALAKEMVVERDTQTRLDHCKSLPVQGQTARLFQDRAAELWSQMVLALPDHVMRFALNSVTDTLPHNSNLSLWGKMPSPGCQLCQERQTLHHILNHCSVALQRRRYNKRHDDILMSLYSFVSNHLPPGHQVTADLPDQCYSFPQDVATTDCRPDMVVWSDQSITLNELTIPFESGMEAAALRKKEKYADLLARCAASNRDSKLVTLEVGSRGFLNTSSFDHLYRCLRSSKQQERRVMEKDIIKKCIVHSHDIWCRRNWSD